MELRLYAVTNMYLSGIHAGIQTAHIVDKLWNKYTDPLAPLPSRLVLREWSEHYKTIIVLNGGYQSVLQSTYDELRRPLKQLGLPMARFYESKEALNGALTVIGFVLPDSVYALPRELPIEEIAQLQTEERHVYNVISRFYMAK